MSEMEDLEVPFLSTLFKGSRSDEATVVEIKPGKSDFVVANAVGNADL